MFSGGVVGVEGVAEEFFGWDVEVLCDLAEFH
jgi:hypothetical protein